MQNKPDRPVNWRQEYIHLVVILMTAIWMAGWVTLSLKWFLTISLPTALGLTTIHLLASMLLVRWTIYRRTDVNTRIIATLLLMGAATGITILLTPALARQYDSGIRLTLGDLFHFAEEDRVPGGPAMIFWALFLWWRGAAIGHTYLTLVRASFGMRLGLLSILIVILAAASDLRTDILAVVPFFFFFGLLGSSLARADSLNLDQAKSGIFGRGWLLSLLALALLVTGGGYVAALWLSGMNTGQVAQVVSTITEVVLTLLFLLISPLLLVTQVIFNAVKSVMPDTFGTPYNISTEEDSSGSQTEAPWLADLFSVLGDALVVGILLLILFAIIAFVWFLWVARGERKEYSDEDRESLGTGEVVGGLRRNLRDNWQRLANWLDALRQFGLGRNLFTALTIRRIYARMEHLAEMRGYPRAKAETPYEYRRELHQAFPDHPDAIQSITEAYIAVRYGEVPEDPAEVEAVRAAWETLKASPEPM
ncbi:MAG: DUF4129 domain-containing protein [Anaerolineae bacterium]|nr:DUF4129 domain-containing protein [Anaerolineae bacterium]